MLRKIKFRAWINDYMCEPEMKYQDSTLAIFFYNIVGHQYDLMQFTGLTDKNGKEIFESDLLKDNKDQVWQVQWNNERARFALVLQRERKEFDGRLGEFYISMQGYQVKEMLIIGNKYEN